MEPYCVLLQGSAYQGCVNKGPPVCTIISCSMLDIFLPFLKWIIHSAYDRYDKK